MEFPLITLHKLRYECLYFQRTPKVDFSEIKEYEPSFDWYDKRLWDLVKSGDENAEEFFRLLALCHTVMAEEKDGKDCKHSTTNATI